MSEHTKEPWKVEGFYVRDIRGNTIADVCAKANAHLIAAAPETKKERDELKAETQTNIDLLKHLLPFFDDAEETTENGVIWVIKETIKRQTELIAKSKGEG